LTKNFEIGTISVPKGEKGYGTLPVAKMSSGFMIDIPIHIITGDPSGPVICIMACVHAHEYTAINAIRHLVLKTDPNKISGTLIAIPVVNTMAFSMASRGNWFDGLWGPSGDLGRAAPGNPRGWISERIAHVLTDNIVPKTDVMIDFHGEAPNRRNYIYYPYLRKGNKGYSQVYRQYVENLGTDLIVEVESSGAGATTGQMLELGKIGIEVEISDFYGLEGEDRSVLKRTATEIGVTCAENTMKKMGILDGKPELPLRQVVLDGYSQVTPKNGGLMKSMVSKRDLCRVMKGGEIIARIFDSYTLEMIEELKAPFSETMLLAIKDGTPFYQVEPAGCDASGFEVCDWEKALWIDNN
jgi:predicted deacylase